MSHTHTHTLSTSVFVLFFHPPQFNFDPVPTIVASMIKEFSKKLMHTHTCKCITNSVLIFL